VGRDRALEAFDADASLQVVRARTVEVYGPDHEPAADAVIYFHGDDEHVGPLHQVHAGLGAWQRAMSGSTLPSTISISLVP
jgi:hypothetical protein